MLLKRCELLNPEVVQSCSEVLPFAIGYALGCGGALAAPVAACFAGFYPADV